MTGSRGFGAYLQRFAWSVDIVDESTFTDVKDLVIDYVERELGVEYFEVMIAPRGTADALQTLWCSKSGRRGTTKKIREGGHYTDQTSYAFGERTRLWIVSGQRGQELEQAETYTDMWSSRKDLPAYQPPLDTISAKTSMAVPLNDDDEPIGVMYLESPSYLEATAVAKNELNLLADAVAVLYSDQTRTKVTTDATQSAIKDLGRILRAGGFPRLTKPKVFVAYAENADKEVIAAIEKVLCSRQAKIEPVFWKSIVETGFVTLKIEKEIRNSAFGVCYLSEPVNREGTLRDSERTNEQVPRNGAASYADNANVLYEAGMMNALAGNEGWIAIREAKDVAGDPPFDLQPLRHVIVARDEDMKLQESRLETDLVSIVDGLLEP